MKKTIIFATLLFVIVVIVIFLGLQSSKPKVETLSNVTDLYSLFTPYMKNIVFSRLNPIYCIPNEYFYNDSSVCFVCNDIVPCFGYGWVNRTGEMMNPKGGLYLSGNYNLESEINFYTFGMFNLLNCECNGECICEDGIKTNKSFGVSFLFPDNMNVSEKIQDIAERKGIEDCQFPQNDTQFYYCEELSVLVSNNEMVFRWEEKV